MMRMQDNQVFFEAIASCQCLDAVYNRSSVRLEPHILYTRNNELYLDAKTAEREGQLPRERKVGSFKLSGLREVSLTLQRFRPDPLFESGDPKYAGVTLFKIDTPQNNPLNDIPADAGRFRAWG